jgi:YegS/Rv2252/BmrU family lipid kinase
MSAAGRRIAVILNASAGAGCTQEIADRVSAYFREHDVEVAMTLAANNEEILKAAQQASCDGYAVIVAGGGDGTVSAVAATLVDTDIHFGLLPLGTLNHLAKDLHIPLDLQQAVRTIVAGHAVKIDVGDVNGRIFLNNSSLGLYPDTVRHRERQQKLQGRGKWPALFIAAIAALRRYPFLNVTLNIDDKQVKRRTPFVFIGNNAYEMEGFHIGARQRLDSGALSLYFVQRTQRLGLLMLALRALTGTLRQAKDFDALSAKSIVIETRHARLRVATDGEVNQMTTPLHYRIRPAALNVLVPRVATSGVDTYLPN